jgi:oligopeptide/dipeptide ABC transporter ATP-binding protein
MAQRAALALALASQPEVLIADEPVTALDWSVRREVLDRLIALAASRALAVLLITHDLDVVRYAAHRVVVMFGGCIVEEIETAALFADSEPLHPYTASLLDALHALRRRESRPSAVLAEPSREGCPYAPRCALRSRRELGARCAADVPWTELSPNHRLRCVGLLP